MINLPPAKLGEILVNAGIVTENVFNTAVEESQRRRQNIVDILIAQNLITKDYFNALVAQTLGVERINLGNVKINEEFLRLLPEEVAKRRRVIVFGRDENGSYQVAMEDPTDLEAIDFLSLRLKGKVRPYLTSDEDLNRGFSLYEKKLTYDFKKIIEESVQQSLRSRVKGDIEKEAADIPIVAIVDNLFAYGYSSRASDIHFEVLDDAVLVRYRIDGVLHEIIRMPKEILAAIVARIKLLSNLRVDEHAKPQDGRFRHKIADSIMDVRVSVIPTFHGEKIALRLLAASQKPLSLSDIGLMDEDLKIVEDATNKSFGMVIASGPTGSGKTTTLYALMNILNRPEVNIVTIEDPIEYDLRYLNQVQVNVAAGVTFASGLRSLLRQDPNVVMVGEVRDNETANIAVQAALTGHLVLSSLHTNDAPTAIPRLMDMGIPPFLVSAVLNTIVAQRLVRSIHKDCVESSIPDADTEEQIRREIKTAGLNVEKVRIPTTLYRGHGCAACNYTGYFGRVGIFEVLRITEAVRKVITSSDFNLDILRSAARMEGMTTMFEDGLHKVEQGITTLEEVFRVIRE
ncbi:MAG: GspE/PulE family protein [Patescibacteria group bacterium]